MPSDYRCIVKGYEQQGSAGWVRSDGRVRLYMAGAQYLFTRFIWSRPAPPLYITANWFLPFAVVLCILTGELEIRSKQRITGSGIGKSFWLRSIFGRYEKKFGVS